MDEQLRQKIDGYIEQFEQFEKSVDLECELIAQFKTEDERLLLTEVYGFLTGLACAPKPREVHLLFNQVPVLGQIDQAKRDDLLGKFEQFKKLIENSLALNAGAMYSPIVDTLYFDSSAFTLALPRWYRGFYRGLRTGKALPKKTLAPELMHSLVEINKMRKMASLPVDQWPRYLIDEEGYHDEAASEAILDTGVHVENFYRFWHRRNISGFDASNTGVVHITGRFR